MDKSRELDRSVSDYLFFLPIRRIYGKYIGVEFLFRPERTISRLSPYPHRLNFIRTITVDPRDTISFQSAVESLRGEVYAAQ